MPTILFASCVIFTMPKTGRIRSDRRANRCTIPAMDITNPKLLYAKAGLFLIGGVISSGLILLECPTLKVAALLVISVWCFARAYYFVFYVIEHYVDPGYKFAGLISFVRYALSHRRS